MEKSDRIPKLTSNLIRRRLTAVDELRELCLRLRVAWLRRENPELNDGDLRRMVMREWLERKEAAWRDVR